MSFVKSSYQAIQEVVEKIGEDSPTLPNPIITATAPSKLHSTLPLRGLGDDLTLDHLLNDIVPALNGPKTSANYYGFVIGGILPIAEVADNIVTAFDQNVQVHLPEQTVCTIVEDRALRMLLDLLDLKEGKWKGRTFTTGATGANVLGLACGRESVLSSEDGSSVAEIGILAACRRKGVDDVQVLTSMGHSSLYKATSIVGFGSGNVVDCGIASKPWKFDFEKLEKFLRKERTASIVVVSCGEVNTGRFATDASEMEQIRRLCDKYGAWLHVDAGKSFASFSDDFFKDFKITSGIYK